MLQHDDLQEEHEHHHGYGIYLVTWIGLMMLTATTVTVAGLHFGKATLLIAMLVASVKATVVALWFMHLKDESKTLKVMVLVSIGTLAIFVSVTFLDILFR